jgi:hypothetical protein
MNGAELYGKVLRVNIAKPIINREAGKAVWSAEDWMKVTRKLSEIFFFK